MVQCWGWAKGHMGSFLLFFFFPRPLRRKMVTVFQLSLHLIMITEEISDLPVSGMGND